MTKPKLTVAIFVLTLLMLGLTWTGYGAGYELHTVSKGDTLYSLAKLCGVSVDELIRLNNLVDSTIRVGDIIELPTSGGDDKNVDTKNGLDLSVATVSVALALPTPKIVDQRQTQSEPKTALEPAKSDTKLRGMVNLTQEEYDLLAKLVHAEARGEPLQGQIAVAAVVLNRVKHPGFPNTVTEVVMEPGQFLSVENGMIELEPSESCEIAVDRALQGEDPSGGAIFFYNPRKSKALAWWQTRTTTAVIGDHNFAI